MDRTIDASPKVGAALRPAAAAAYLGISVSKVWELAKNDPEFARPIKLSAQVTAFRVRELDAWLDIMAAKSVPSRSESLKKVRAEREAKRVASVEAAPKKRRAKRSTITERRVDAV